MYLSLNEGIHILHSRGHCSSARCCHLTGAIIRFSKVYPTICLVNHFRVTGKMVKPVKSMSISPSPYFIGCKMGFLISTNADNKVFCMSKKRGFGRHIAGKENKFIIYNVKCFSSENKALPFPWWKWFYAVICHWLVGSLSPSPLAKWIGTCWRLGVGLYDVCLIGSSAVAMSRSDLVSENPCCWVHA